MSTDQISVKHNKHRVYPCPHDKKLSLLNLLIAQHNKIKILIVTADNSELIKNAITAKNTTIMDDKELFESTETTCELLISYDLPQTANLYMLRLSKATEIAVVLLDSSEQKQLYPIETLLGRTIKQDIIEGFEYKEDYKMVVAQKPAERQKREYAFKTDSDDKPKYEKSKKKSYLSEKKPFDKPKYNKPKKNNDSNDKSKPWDKKDKKPNKFLGKDDNGKALFSGKSGERNHRHDGTPKEKYDAPKKVGRKISIKERKPKETPES